MNQLNIKFKLREYKFKFSHPKGTSLCRIASYDVLNVKIGRSGASVGARKNWEKIKEKFEGFACIFRIHGGRQKTLGGLTPNFLMVSVRDVISRVSNLVTFGSGV